MNSIPFNQFFNSFKGFIGDPIQMMPGMNIPKNMMNNPNEMI